MSFKDARRYDAFAVVEVVRAARLSPHVVRVTVGGELLAGWPRHGYDQWLRLILPDDERTGFDLAGPLECIGHLDFLRDPAAAGRCQRDYTVRSLRPDQREMDIDLVLHGDRGVASRWAQRTRPGDRVAIIDQGRGYDPTDDPAAHQLLVADETGLAAVAGILRDLPREARGDAFIELADAADQQELAAPEGVAVHWLTREPGSRPGALAIETVQAWQPPRPGIWAYLVGERAIPTTLRRWLVNEHQVSKAAIAFVGYWRIS